MMPKQIQINRGPQRLIFNNASVVNVQHDSESQSYSRIGSIAPIHVAGPMVTTVRFFNQPNAVYSEAIDLPSIQERVNGRGNGAINYDAVLLLDLLSTAEAARLRLATELATAHRDYEASKHLWRKRYEDQGAYSEYDDDWDDYR